MNRMDSLYLIAAFSLWICALLGAHPGKRRTGNAAFWLMQAGQLLVLGGMLLWSARQAAFWRMAMQPAGAVVLFVCFRALYQGAATAALAAAMESYAATQLALALAGASLAGLPEDAGWLGRRYLIAGVFCIAVPLALLAVRRAFGTKETEPTAPKRWLVMLPIMASVLIINFAGGEYPLLPAADELAKTIRLVQILVNLCAVLLMTQQQITDSRQMRHRQETAARLDAHSRYEGFCRSHAAAQWTEQRAAEILHELSLAQNETDPARSRQTIEDAAQRLRRDLSRNKTGNAVLDTLFAEAKLRCEQQQICFTVLAQGALLGEMPAQELCSLVGGMLDEAIATTQTGEKNKHPAISVQLDKMQQFVRICIRYTVQKKQHQNKAISKQAQRCEQTGPALAAAYAAVKKYGGGFSRSQRGEWKTLCAIVPLSVCSQQGQQVDLYR